MLGRFQVKLSKEGGQDSFEFKSSAKETSKSKLNSSVQEASFEKLTSLIDEKALRKLRFEIKTLDQSEEDKDSEYKFEIDQCHTPPL